VGGSQARFDFLEMVSGTAPPPAVTVRYDHSSRAKHCAKRQLHAVGQNSVF
jgi:hypothetical protein